MGDVRLGGIRETRSVVSAGELVLEEVPNAVAAALRELGGTPDYVAVVVARRIGNEIRSAHVELVRPAGDESMLTDGRDMLIDTFLKLEEERGR
jgi:hypothetical protein